MSSHRLVGQMIIMGFLWFVMPKTDSQATL
jgi:hypothetical protein